MDHLNSMNDFLKSPLVVWVQSYLDAPVTSNENLANGVLLNKVLDLIDHVAFGSLRIQANAVNDTTSYAHNLAEILHGIKKYYLEKLQQIVVMKMPDVLMLAKEPNNELSYSEMSNILLLMLGCAVQCDKKNEFIEHIKELDVNVQRGLVMSIQQITEDSRNIIPYRVSELPDMPQEELVQVAESLYFQLRNVLEQRDDYVEAMLDLALMQDTGHENDIVEESPRFRPRHPLSPRTSFRSTNILQANRQRLVSLQTELDDRTGYINDLKEELEQMKLQLDNVRQDNKQLITEAGWAKQYRDELDILKLQLENTAKTKAENTRLKEKVRDVEFYKKKYEETKEQNDQLYESKLILEEKIAGSNSKISRYSHMDEENKRLYSQVKVLIEERDDDQKRIRELVDEVAKLSMEKQESLSAYSVMNAELDGLKMQKHDDGSNVPLLMEYSQSSSSDIMRLERENKHLETMLQQFRSATPDSRLREIELENKRLSENLLDYKNMISKLTKSLLAEKNSNQLLAGTLESQTTSIKSLRGTLTKRQSELEQTTIELDNLTKELAKKGVVIDAESLRDALQLETSDGGTKDKIPKILIEDKTWSNKALEQQVQSERATNFKLKEDLAIKSSEIKTLESKVKHADSYVKKVEEQLEQKEHDVQNLQRRFEQKLTENKALSQNVTIQEDKVVALEERVSHLMSAASEDTRKINQSLETKLQKISELETKLLQLNENSTELEKTQELLKRSEEKTISLKEQFELTEGKQRELEIEYEKSKNNCTKLEHFIKLKDERIRSLESSINELTVAANGKHNERIGMLMKSLETRSDDIATLEKKLEELLESNSKLKASNRSKNDQVQMLEDRLSGLEGKLTDKSSLATQDDRVKVLNKQLTEREGQLDELEVRLEDTQNVLNKTKRSLEHKDEKINALEQNLQDLEDLNRQRERLTNIVEDKSKRILDLEMMLDNLQNENAKLERTLAQKDEEYQIATQSLGTLEASITDQSSLSKLVQIKENKIIALSSVLDEKDKVIVSFENKLSESDGKVKKLTHTLKFKEEKLSSLEEGADKLEEFETKNKKLQTIMEDKDAKMLELENKLDQLNEQLRQNTRLKDNLKSKEEKITGLEERIDDLEESVKMNERLNQQVKQKEERIAFLQERIEELENRLHKSEQSRDIIKKNAEAELIKLSEQNQQLSDVKVKRQISIMRRENKIVNLESRLNQYAAERQEKDSKIKELQHRLEDTLTQFQKKDMTQDEKDSQMDEMNDRMEEIKETYRENQKLSKLLQKKDIDIINLQKKLDDLDVNNNRNSSLLSSRDESIRGLQERLEETLSLNNRLNISTKKQEEKIKSFELTLHQNELRLEVLSTEIENKDRIIERNKEKYDQLRHQIEEKQAEIVELDKLLSSLRSCEGEKDRLSILLTEKEAFVAELESKLQLMSKSTNSNDKHTRLLREKEEEIEKLLKKTNELASEKHRSRLNLQEKEGLIAEFERRIEELQLTATDSDKLNIIVKEKNSQISILRQSLDEYQSNTAQLETRLEELSSEQTRSNHALKQKDERLQTLKTELEDYINKNHKLVNDLEMKEETLNSLEKSLKEMTERNKDLEEDINMLEKDLEELKKTGSWKNITNITEKIQLTKRARTELHIQRGPPKVSTAGGQKIRIKMSPGKLTEVTKENETVDLEKLTEQNDLLEKQKSRLTQQMENLSQQNASLLTKNESLQSNYDLLRKDYEAVQEEMNQAREHFQELDVSATKIAHRCEVLVQLNATLEEENKALMDQVNKLLAQNQELLFTTLSSRDQFLDDERTFSDHIYGLEREKEKLSEKVVAAEKALMDSGNKKKGVLWRGTKKILKKAGLGKKKGEYNPTFSSSPDPDALSDSLSSANSTPSHGVYHATDSPSSPLGPIRGLLSKSRQDISKLDDNPDRRKSFGMEHNVLLRSDIIKPKPRPKSEYNPLLRIGAVRRPKSMVNVTTGGSDGEEDCAIIPLAKGDLYSDVGSVLSNESSINNTPIISRRSSTQSNGSNTPIQKVRVTQIQTAQVMRMPPETVDIIARNPLDDSPGAVRRTSGSTGQSAFTSTPVAKELDRPHPSLLQRSRKDNLSFEEILTVENIPFERQHVLRTSSRRKADKQNISHESGDITPSSARSKYDSSDSGPPSNRSKYESEIFDSHHRVLNRSESFSPPASSNPFGSREQRSSFRRFEMDKMERRPLPETQNFDSDSETHPAMDKLVKSFDSRDQRSVDAKIQRSSTEPDRHVSDLRRTESEKKRNADWYEYGNV